MNWPTDNRIFEELKKRKVDQKTISRTRDLLVAYMKEHPHRESRYGFFDIFKQATPRLRFAVASFTVLFLAVSSGASTYAFAQEALPGDSLYPVKLFTEKVSLRIAPDQAKRAALRREHFERRTWELERVIGQADVTEGKSSRLGKGISAALEDAQGQAEELEKNDGHWDKDSRDSDFYRTSERLRMNAMILEKVLSDETLQRSTSGAESGKALSQTKKLMQKIDQELKQPQSSKDEAAKAVLEAAAGSIKDAEEKISGKSVGSERKKGAEKDIKKAKELLKEAKDDYEANKLDKSYEKALKAVEQSTFTERTLDVPAEPPKVLNTEAGQGSSESNSRESTGSGSGDNRHEDQTSPRLPATSAQSDGPGNVGSSDGGTSNSGSSKSEVEKEEAPRDETRLDGNDDRSGRD